MADRLKWPVPNQRRRLRRPLYDVYTATPPPGWIYTTQISREVYNVNVIWRSYQTCLFSNPGLTDIWILG